MRRQDDGAVEQAGRVDVGDEGTLTQGELGALVAPERLADAAVLDDRRQRGAAELRFLNELHRVDDLLISGAAAEMPVEHARNVGARQSLALVGHPFDAQHEARRAEAALQAGGRLEGVGIKAPLGVGDAFEREDSAAVDLFGAHRAGELGLAVEQHQAAAALPLGRAARLDRLDLERLAQDLDEKLVRPRVDPTGFAVELELDRLHVVRPGRSPAHISYA